MNTPSLRMILLPSLRTLHSNYYMGEDHSYKFVVLNTVGLTGFEVRVGVWLATSAPNQQRWGEVTITLYKKDEPPGNCRRFFTQEAVNMLREDEFGWLLWSIQCIGDYKVLIQSAANGDKESYIIYMYLLTLAKHFEVGAELIFDYLRKLTGDTGTIDITALLQKPW